MKKTIKKLVTLGMVSCLTVASCMTALAGQWKTHPEYDMLWTYMKDDGTYAIDCWETIDGKSYHFDSMGILETDCVTADGFYVDENGVWDGSPQMSEAEIDEYYKQLHKDALIAGYEFGYDVNELIAEAKEYFGEEQGQEIMDYIQSNYEHDIYGLNNY